jgi:glycine hydroxymethyltransferase
VPGDNKPLNPSGIRLGSPAMTTRGCKEADFIEIMKFLERAIEAVNKVSNKSKSNKIKDFKESLQSELENAEITALRKDIKAFA